MGASSQSNLGYPHRSSSRAVAQIRLQQTVQRVIRYVSKNFTSATISAALSRGLLCFSPSARSTVPDATPGRPFSHPLSEPPGRRSVHRIPLLDAKPLRMERRGARKKGGLALGSCAPRSISTGSFMKCSAHSLKPSVAPRALARPLTECGRFLSAETRGFKDASMRPNPRVSWRLTR